MIQLRFLTLLTLLSCYPVCSNAQSSIELKKNDHSVSVTLGGEPFCAYNFQQTEKPFLHPVLGPNQIRMTRNYPMKQTEGEADDHPHHKSIWIGHEINGIDFWTCRGGARIVVQGEPDIDSAAKSITAKSNWIDAGGKVVCLDTTTWTFGSDEDSRWIDCKFKLEAVNETITIDDTKEGTVAIRTHPDLRLNPDPNRGVKEVFGSAINSLGTEGKDVWGQSASWLLYSGTIESKPASILILADPGNFRHPTTWHARDYGLIGANPFGLHYFQQMEKGAGAVTLAKDQSISLHYRFVFLAKTIDAKIAHQYFEAFSPAGSELTTDR